MSDNLDEKYIINHAEPRHFPPPLTVRDSDPQQGQEVAQAVPQGMAHTSYFFFDYCEHIGIVSVLFNRLSILDRLLTPLIILVMIVGVIIGEFVPNVQATFDTVRFDSVSVRT